MANAAGDWCTWCLLAAWPISTLTRCRSGEIRLAEDRMPDEAALLGSDLILATVGVMGIVLGEEFSCRWRSVIMTL